MAYIKNINTMVSDGASTRAKSTKGQASSVTQRTKASGSGTALNGSGSSAYNQHLIEPAQKAAAPVTETTIIEQPTPTSSMSSGYDLSGYLRKQQAAALEAELAGLKGAYAQSLAAYNAALDKLPQTYDVARNSVAGQNALARQGFDERAAASGLSSGAAAQAELARDSVYRGTLAGIDREQANAASEIELTKAKLQSQYESAIAQAKAGGDASLASALYQELVRVQGLNRDDEQRAQNIALQYGLKNGVSLGDVANIRSIADLANLTYYGSNGKATGGGGPLKVSDPTEGTPDDPGAPVVLGASSLISVPGYGEIDYEDAERLEEQGYIKLIGADKAGNPIYSRTAKTQTENIAFSR